jgi:hypothetical protein
MTAIFLLSHVGQIQECEVFPGMEKHIGLSSLKGNSG